MTQNNTVSDVPITVILRHDNRNVYYYRVIIDSITYSEYPNYVPGVRCCT